MEQITSKNEVEISISVVSHSQIHLVDDLLQDICLHCRAMSLEFILTLNREEMLPFDAGSFSFPVKIVRNSLPKGFSANHNQAFSRSVGRFFCVMNPDIRFDSNPFPELLACLQASSAGVVAPLVVGQNGTPEDSARRFPTPLRFLCRIFGKCKGIDYPVKNEPIFPDWVGGMFMLIPMNVFSEVGGFDTGYFLYYEDVDLCARLTLLGYKITLCPEAVVIHNARRDSHANPRYLRWHISSALRFFLSPVYRQLRQHKQDI